MAGSVLRSRHHRRRHQRLRHRARRRRPRPFGLPLRTGRPRRRHLVGLDQADPRRPALSRVLRVPAGARGAGRARGAAQGGARTSSGRCASCCRTTTGCGRAGAPARPLPLRPSRRPRASCRRPAVAGSQPRSRRRAAASRATPRLRVFRLLGRRCAAGRAQRPRRALAWRRASTRGRAASTRGARTASWVLTLEGRATGAVVDDHRPRPGQRRRALGDRRPRQRHPASTRRPRCGWSRAATSSSSGSSTTTAPTSSRTPTAASSSPFPMSTTSR